MAHLLLIDSGVGGLSVADEIAKLLPAAALSYVADNAWFPYGSREPAALIRRVVAVVGAAVGRLRPDLLVVACNTASTVALPALRQAFAIPVVGVVPAVKPAAALSQRRVIGLLGTPGTVSALYTDDLVRRFAEDCRVIRVGSPALVALAEGLLAGCAPDPRQVAAELAPFFGAGEAAAPDVVVLACTHFPLLRAVLAEVAPPRVRFIDSGAAVARRVRDLLGEADDRPAVRGVAFFTAESETATAQSHAFRIRGFETPGLLEIA